MPPSPSPSREDFFISDMSSLELPSPTWRVSEEEDREAAQYMAHVRRMEKFRAHYSGIHGAMLLFQAGLAMVVVIFLLCVAWWKADEGVARDESGDGLQIACLSTAVVALILSVAGFLHHAIYLLSEGVLVILQTAILAVTAACVTLIGVKSMEEDNRALKVIMVGGDVLFGVLSALAFTFAVVAWRRIGLLKRKLGDDSTCPYLTSCEPCRLTKNGCDYVNTRIRAFMRLNEIEKLTAPILDDMGSAKTLDEALPKGLAIFHQLRSSMVLTAMKGTTGIYGNSLSDDYKEYKRLSRFLSKFARDEYETGTKEVLQLRKLKERQEAMEHKSISSRLKKIRSTRKANNDDAAALEELTTEYNQRLDLLDDAWTLLEKHCVILNMAQDNMVWNADVLFSRKGITQGKLFTNGFEAKHFTKLASGMWSVQMKWRAEYKTEWRPGTIWVDRRFGCFTKTEVDWIQMPPARIVSSPGDMEFPVEIRITVKGFEVNSERKHNDWDGWQYGAKVCYHEARG
ncbi:hypothetical protein MKX08_006452 [Trichoderma sp. CBMAI-0020]|nr:hypothetical protein MKX08_006452 [Trichoderma sp. CBMAI-0020]